MQTDFLIIISQLKLIARLSTLPSLVLSKLFLILSAVILKTKLRFL